jgi:hypothetical protein
MMQRLLGVLVSLCLLVQPLLVPLHLALHEHTHGEPGSTLALHQLGALHRHEHPHAHPHIAGDHDSLAGDDEGDPDHPPHPAKDHASQAQPQQTAPGFDVGPITIPCVVEAFVWALGQSAFVPHAPRRAPEKPPPRGPTQSRAPPSVV